MKGYLSLLTIVLLSLLSLASCKENEKEDYEYANWQNRNTEYFNKIYDHAKTANNSTWKIIPKWSLGEEAAAGKASNYIVVEVLYSSGREGSPLYTDSAYVNYRGRLIPTVYHADGWVFDQTYKSTDYVPELALPKLIGVGEGTIDGITTALMNMHIGDRWRVYIPQELGYRTTDKGSIPAFSTLIFDLSLMAYYRAGANIPEWK